MELEFFVTAGGDLHQAQRPVQRVGALGMLADLVRPLAGRLRVGGLQLCGVHGDLVGVCAHRRRGVAAGEVGDKAVGVALVGHVDEGFPLDHLPAVLADGGAALFLLPCPLGLSFADLERTDEGGQLVFQRDAAGIPLPEDRLLLPSRVTVTSSLPETVKYLFTVVRSVRLGYSVWVVKAKPGRPRSSNSRTVTLTSQEGSLIDRSGLGSP